MFLALKCFEKAVLDLFSLLGAKALFCMGTAASYKAHSSVQTGIQHREPLQYSRLMVADMLDRFSRESKLTVAERKFPTAELKGAERVCFECGREGETCPGDFSLAPRVRTSLTFVV